MIVQIIGGVVIALLLTLLMRALWVRSGITLARAGLTLGIAALVVALVVLAATGRLHWLLAAGAALAPFARRLIGLLRFVPILNHLFPGWHRRFGRTGFGRGTGLGGRAGVGGLGAGADARHSEHYTTSTAHLRMSLHRASGHMDGEVLTGKHRGRFLSELELPELVELLNELRGSESERLLTTFLDRTHPDWRTQGASEPRSGMSVDQAREVLGVPESATRDEILAAHRRLIQRLHPDRGGSSYLAATLNEARRVLLPEE